MMESDETNMPPFIGLARPQSAQAEAMPAQQDLAAQLADMESRKDLAYLERNQVVAALAKCFPSGIKRTAIEGWSEEWHGCVYIDLPTGQASWHYHDSHAHLFSGLPSYTGAWDGHSTEAKYSRLSALLPQPGLAARVAELEALLRDAVTFVSIINQSVTVRSGYSLSLEQVFRAALAKGE